MPRSEPVRAGAVAIPKASSHDLKALARLATAIREQAPPLTTGDDPDTVTASAAQGEYGWRAYLHDEVREARRRDAPPARPKRAPEAREDPAPSVFYA